MKKIISGIAIFSIGFVSGILATAQYMKKQNEEVEDEVEIESEKMPGGENPENNDIIERMEEMTEELEEYEERIKNEDYYVNENTTVIPESRDIMYDSDTPDQP